MHWAMLKIVVVSISWQPICFGAENRLEQKSLDSMRWDEVASCLMKTWGVCNLVCAQVIKMLSGVSKPMQKSAV